jgi:hypothetical protein
MLGDDPSSNRLLGRNGETRFRNVAFLMNLHDPARSDEFVPRLAAAEQVGLQQGVDPTMWAGGVTPWDGPCHTHRVQHLCVIIIDERVG